MDRRDEQLKVETQEGQNIMWPGNLTLQEGRGNRNKLLFANKEIQEDEEKDFKSGLILGDDFLIDGKLSTAALNKLIRSSKELNNSFSEFRFEYGWPGNKENLKTWRPIGCPENENGNPQTLPNSLIQQIFIKGIQMSMPSQNPGFTGLMFFQGKLTANILQRLKRHYPRNTE